MLSANEFTVGALGDATPLSLMLPRTKYESMILVGQIENRPTAVFVGGRYNFRCFECGDSTNWKGLLIPNVRIEVDETSLFDPDDLSAPPGTIVRTDTRLVVLAKSDQFYGGPFRVSLESELPPANDLSAAFSKWRIVIGAGQDRRVLRDIDTGQNIASPC